MLIDDVFTTGSTSNEISKLLLKHKVYSVVVLTFLKTDPSAESDYLMGDNDYDIWQSSAKNEKNIKIKSFSNKNKLYKSWLMIYIRQVGEINNGTFYFSCRIW